MSDLAELYQSVILDHGRRPRNRGTLADATGTGAGRNPSCGDQCTVQVRVEHDAIAAVRFEASGCAISQASASLMTSLVAGRSPAEAQHLVARFRALVTGTLDPVTARAELGAAAALGGVARFPLRVKCATLAWHALLGALDASGATPAVGTES